MKKVLFSMSLLAGVLLFAACKKDDKPELTTAQKIQTKWSLDKRYYHGVEPGFPEYRDTIPGVPSDYADFRTDNKVYSFFDAEYDTVSYTILSDSKIIIDGDTYDIQVLTESQFQIYSKETVSPTEYYEATLFLKK